MKTYNQTNFFKHTFCEFHQVNDLEFPEKSNYKSKSDSLYFYTKDGVYRKSNHWGRVANCRWKIIANKNYKNQNIVIGFAKWTDFYPINSSEKNFFIAVDFEKKTAKIQSEKEKKEQILFSYTEAQKRVKQINNLFKNDKWADYYNLQKDKLIKEVISEFINTYKSLSTIKKCFNR